MIFFDENILKYHFSMWVAFCLGAAAKKWLSHSAGNVKR